MKKFLVLALFLAQSPMVFAESNVEASPATSNTMAAPEVKKPSSILSHVIAGWKSRNNTGRAEEMNSEKGREMALKQEVWAGYKHDSGWGLYGMYAGNYNNFKDDAKTKWNMADPSITLVHPALYTSDNLKVTGKLRRYLPLSKFSDAHNMVQTAYYIDATYKMGRGQEIYNNVTFRNFTYDTHGPGSTDYYVEDTTNYTKEFAKNWRWGLGHWTQYESHFNTSPGLTVELVPMLDYMITPKSFMGPRVYLPIAVNNKVNDGAKDARWNQAYFQFFVLMNL
jgi:hypothetical protein